jgi:hypothetical protein
MRAPMRSWLVTLLIGCGAPAVPATERETVPTNLQESNWKDGPRGFPVPGDAADHARTTDDNITYKIGRPYVDVHAELSQYLQTHGFTLGVEQRTSEHIIVEVGKAGTRYEVALTNYDTNTTLMQVSVIGRSP